MAANYSTNYPALPPLASERNDNPAPAIAAGTALTDQDIIAAENQHHQRKHLLAIGEATADEVVASKKRMLQVTAERAEWDQTFTLLNNLNDSLHDPNTGLVALSNTLTNLNNTLNDLNTGLAAVNNTLTNLSTGLAAANYKMDIEAARNMNRTVIRTNQDPITPVPDAAGHLPAAVALWFPKNNRDLESANDNRADALLAFYDLGTSGNLDAKRARIRAHVGILL